MHVAYSFCKLFTLLSFLILTQNCAFASLINVGGDRPSLAKVFLSYLKVPWINFNSSWADEVTPNCKKDIATLFEAAEAGEMWAFQMLDATSKIPAGILTGNIRDLGMYDQCVTVEANKNRAGIQGRHCMVSLAMPTKFVESASDVLSVQKLSVYNPSADVDFSLTGSVCLPASCGVEDVIGYVNSSIQSTPELIIFEVSIAQVTCSEVETGENYFTEKILITIIFVVIVSLLLTCTICDLVIRARPDVKVSGALETVVKFSLYTNMIKLSSTKTGPDTMRAIHGIRFLNTCMVVAGHRIVSTLFKPLVNLSHGYELRQTVVSTAAEMLLYVVETFFIISGFLTAYFFLKALREGKKFNLIMIYVYRYLRLTPSLIAVMLFTMYFLPSIGSGPMWERITDVLSGTCRKNWWTNLLYIQNFVNKEEMCLFHTWYLAVEMQLFYIAPFMLYPIFYRPKLGLAFLGLLSIAAFIIPAVQIAVNQWAVIFNSHIKFLTAYYDFLNSYTATYNRALSYLIGIFLGYGAVNNKRRFTKRELTRNWILTVVLVLVSGLATYYVQPHAPTFNIVWEIIFVSIGRLAWCIAMAWLLYACTHGYGGIITRFLSLPMFVPLSRISYSIYLVHLVLQVAVAATEHTAEFAAPFSVVSCPVLLSFWFYQPKLYPIGGDLAVSIVLGFILTLCIESPIIILLKVFMNGASAPISCDSSSKPKELSEIIKEYLNQTKRKVSTDVAVGRTKGQVKLRRTVSEVLKTNSANEVTKTPAEWVKIWQDWKCYLLKNNDKQDTCIEDAQNEHPRFPTEIPVSKNELLIFFTGVSCGLDEASSVESDFSVSKMAQPIPYDWQDKRYCQPSTLESTPSIEKRSKFSGST